MILNSFLFLLAFYLLTALAWGHTDVPTTTAKTMIDTNNELIVIGVLEPGEYCGVNGHIPGALNYPLASLFKSDFGRSSLQNPCPICSGGMWCSY